MSGRAFAVKVTTYYRPKQMAWTGGMLLNVRAHSISPNGAGIDCTGGGEYLEIGRPRHLSFTFTILQFSPNNDGITVEIAPSGAGCVLTLTQEGVDIAGELRALPASVAGGTETGWINLLDALTAVLE